MLEITGEIESRVGARNRYNRFWNRLVSFFIDNKSISMNSETQKNLEIEAILNDYGNNIIRIAYSYFHNMFDAEDILQDTLLQYIKVKPSLESETHKKAWLLRVAINLSKNKIKYNRIRRADELGENLQTEKLEDLLFVWEAVKDLPIKYREVIHLYYYEGYSTSEIGAILSKKNTTVRSLLQRARFRLKDILKEAYDFEE